MKRPAGERDPRPGCISLHSAPTPRIADLATDGHCFLNHQHQHHGKTLRMGTGPQHLAERPAARQRQGLSGL
jgi:hypothetical protein